MNSSCTLNIPYPDLRIKEPNRSYARAMLDNVGGRNSEMSAVGMYFYNSLRTGGYQEVADAYHCISVVEMHHLDIFGHLAMMLGEDPRLWTQVNNRKIYWTPGYLEYSCDLPQILTNSIRAEQSAIKKYTFQGQVIQDEFINAMLKRIIQDEEHHIKILTELYKKYVNAAG